MTGITFARRIGKNQIEMVTIPTLPAQRFIYFYDPSKLSKDERDEMIKLKALHRALLNESNKLKEND